MNRAARKIVFLIVAFLAMFEIVVTQLVGPVGYPSIAMNLLGQMHYGRDDVVITTAIAIMVSGVIIMQICGPLLTRWEK